MGNYLWRKLRNGLIAGLVVLLPVWLTLFSIYWVFTNLDAAVSDPLRRYLNWVPPGLGILLAVLLTLLVGWLTNYLIGRRLLDFGERLLMRLPFTRPIYVAFKQVTEAVLNPKDRRAFSRVVLVEYPRREVYSLAFVAGEMPELGLLRLWLPGGPSPAGGPVVMVPVDDTVLLPITVEEGLKLIISAGVLSPNEEATAAIGDGVARLQQRRRAAAAQQQQV
jgi:uncharacterized membrane protein